MIRQQSSLFQKILENNAEGIVITNDKGIIKWINHAFTKITNYSLPEIQGKNMNILKSSIHKHDFYKEMWHKLVAKGQWTGEVCIGSAKWRRVRYFFPS